jgi:hypothetical protein
MNGRNLSIIVVLILANYLVFSTLAVIAFPPAPFIPPTRAVEATYTPGAQPLQRVGALTYDFLTPSPTATITGTLTPATRQP